MRCLPAARFGFCPQVLISGDNINIDLHVHTKYSADCNTDPIKIIRTEISKGVDCIAVTDHNNFSSFKNFNKKIKIIKGEEISTNKGHLIGLFLEESVKSRDFSEACDEIRSQGAVSILPHPFRAHKDPGSLVRAVDMVEAFNSRTSLAKNEAALELARISNKPVICGSDAHFLSELGSATVEVETENVHEAGKLLLKGRFKMNFTQSPFYVHPMTWIVKGGKIAGHLVRR
ncbi:MAG: PHP domain-containing protein [Candidatus Aenigmarchaeota archaeon]|nr:PHP domain-containing protein [Candidatus Aenigmarchaeota archaeon]